MAQTTTWAEHVAPILYNNCTKCHNPDGAGHFSLMTFSEAFMTRYNIQYMVTAGKMPPWPPDTTFSRFAHERTLKASEVQTINDWVNGGALSGDLGTAPTPPVYASGPQMGAYDLELTMPTYTVNAVNDLYRCFVIPSGLLTQKMITALEVIPGNRNIVHHVLVYQDTTYGAYQLDQADQEPGYTSFGGIGVSGAKLIAGWVPGSGPNILPNGFGVRLAPNADVVMQIHYPSGTFNETDSTKIIFRFAPSVTGIRSVGNAPILNHQTNLQGGPLFIPADSIRTFKEAYQLPGVNVSLISVAPHMHLIGRNIVSYAVSPAQDTIPFIRINNWDFQWQGGYNFKKVMKIPASSWLYAEALYDNTANNPFNPSDPPIDVSLGESTTDEMMLVYFQYLLYHSGDENILIDSSDIATGTEAFDFSDKIKSLQLYDLYPNPSRTDIAADFYLPKTTDVAIKITDMQGKTLFTQNEKTIVAGITTRKFDISSLPAGVYSLSVNTGNVSREKQFIVQ